MSSMTLSSCAGRLGGTQYRSASKMNSAMEYWSIPRLLELFDIHASSPHHAYQPLSQTNWDRGRSLARVQAPRHHGFLPFTFTLSTQAMDIFNVGAMCWRQVGNTEARRRTFRRPLGPIELNFYWDSQYNGVAVLVNHMDLEAVEGLEDEVFGKKNFELAWLRMKQRFPLLGASVEELPGSEHVEFVLAEESLHRIRVGELNWVDNLKSAEDVARFEDELRTGPSVLDNGNLARLFIGIRDDSPRRCHIFIPIVHYITDGIGNASLESQFCQELSSLPKDTKVPTPPLPSRLAMLVPAEAHTPSAKMSVARRRWRFAAAKVIQNIRFAKLTGGQTLPKRHPMSPDTPVISRTITVRISPSLTQAIVRGCHSLGVTLGNALPVLSQVAFARVLHRMHRKGQLSDEELQHRRTQPMHFISPLNYRPFLDKAWNKAGGAMDICIAIGWYNYTLPFMPSSGTVDETNAPPLSSLLSLPRFLARARMVRKDVRRFFRQPLLHELHLLRLPERSRRRREAVLARRAIQDGENVVENNRQLADLFAETEPCIFSHGGGSLGNRDPLLPSHFPLPSAPKMDVPPARVHVRAMYHDMRVSPGELYLGAVTNGGQLAFFTCVDLSTYDEAVVREWTEEVTNAAVFYFAQHDNCRDEAQRSNL